MNTAVATKTEYIHPKLNRFILNVKPSPTLAAAGRARELIKAGRDIVSFTVGEPDFDTPEHIKKAAAEAMAKGFTKYTAVDGIPVLKEVIQQKLKEDQALQFAPAEIIVTNGGKQGLAATFAVLLNEGDEVVIPSPYWTSYPDMVSLAGGHSVIVETTPQSGYLMTPEQLKRACNAKTKAIVINSPSNPTGAAYSGEQLRALAEAFLELPNWRDIMIISDEVYEYFTYGDFKHYSILQVAPELRSQVVISSSFSKCYSMTGWRVGFAAGPRWLIDALSVHQSQFTTNVCSIAQYAAAAAYTDGREFPRMMRDEFSKRYELVLSAVNSIPGLSLPTAPLGAFYAFVRIEELLGKRNGDVEIRSAQDFTNYLLERYDVASVQGEAFGDPKGFRLSYALSRQQIEKGMERIAKAVASLG
jgi:aspartate aminotransferase